MKKKIKKVRKKSKLQKKAPKKSLKKTLKPKRKPKITKQAVAHSEPVLNKMKMLEQWIQAGNNSSFYNEIAKK